MSAVLSLASVAVVTFRGQTSRGWPYTVTYAEAFNVIVDIVNIIHIELFAG